MSTTDTALVATILALTVALIAYSKYIETQKDLGDVVLNDQTSVASTRKSGETAHYRNLLVPHGFPLIHGLSIKHGYKLRDGNIRDIWSVCMDSILELGPRESEERTVTFYNCDGKPRFAASYAKLNTIFRELGLRLRERAGSNKDKIVIGCAMPFYTHESFLVSMACFLNKMSFHTLHKHLMKKDFGFDVMFLYSKDLVRAVQYQKSVKLFVVVDELEAKYAQLARVVSWREFAGDWIAACTGSPAYENFRYSPEEDEFTPLVETFNYITTVYTNQNLVTAVACEIKNMPVGTEWDPTVDELIVCCEDSSIAVLCKILSAVFYGMKLSVVEPFAERKITSIEIEDQEKQYERENHRIALKFRLFLTKYTPQKRVLLCVPQLYLKIFLEHCLSQYEASAGPIKKIFRRRSEVLFQKGVYTAVGQIDELFGPVRLVYAYTNSNFAKNHLSSSYLFKLRVLMGARIVCERFLNGTVAPVFYTHMYDYRFVKGSHNFTIRGVPSQGLEVKLVDYRFFNESHLADNDSGELCIRGFTIGRVVDENVVEQKRKEGERVGGNGWMPTGLIGYWGSDGCFYEKLFQF